MTKKILFSLMLTALIGVLAACNKDDEACSTGIADFTVDSFYVKYEIFFSDTMYGGAAHHVGTSDETIHYKDVAVEKDSSFLWGEDNLGHGYFYPQRSRYTWETTCGPFRKGERVYLWSEPGCTSNDTWQHRYSISVSKNDEPYVVKAEGPGWPKTKNGNQKIYGLEYIIE